VPTRNTVGSLDEMDMPCGSESVLAVSGVQSAAAIIGEVVAEANELIAEGFV
jgi:hypothetical protein